MAHVVTEACIKCKFMECVEVCPTEAFHEGANFVVINPASCANCGLCQMVCPVSAIFPRSELPPDLAGYAKLNMALAARWPKMTAKSVVPPDAEEWAAVAEKGHLLEQ